MIKEITVRSAVEYEHQPDGGKTPVLDAYDGCQFSCPYCFQWRDKTWNNNILVKTNFPEILSQELKTWDTTQAMYVGSRSDPYMPLESHYRLTRRTLQILQEYGFPCFLSTKSNAPAFFDDIDLFLKYKDKLTICIGQVNLMHLQIPCDQGDLPNIRTANELERLGIPTWVFITPVLPGITDVKTMIDALSKNMPIFLDKLRLDFTDTFSQRFFAFLKVSYPELESRYRTLLHEGTDPYYDELKEMYRDESRIQFVFGEN